MLDHRGARPRRRRRDHRVPLGLQPHAAAVHRAPRGDAGGPRPAGRARHRQGAELRGGAPARPADGGAPRHRARLHVDARAHAAPQGDRAPDRAGRGRRRAARSSSGAGRSSCRSWPSSPTATPTARCGSASRRCRASSMAEVPAHAEAIRSRQPVIVARGGEPGSPTSGSRAFDLTLGPRRAPRLKGPGRRHHGPRPAAGSGAGGRISSTSR